MKKKSIANIVYISKLPVLIRGITFLYDKNKFVSIQYRTRRNTYEERTISLVKNYKQK